MSHIQKFEKYTTGTKDGKLISSLKDVKDAIKGAESEELEKARYIVADIKSKIEAKIKSEDKD